MCCKGKGKILKENSEGKRETSKLLVRSTAKLKKGGDLIEKKREDKALAQKNWRRSVLFIVKLGKGGTEKKNG